jgi:hypothetical protein
MWPPDDPRYRVTGGEILRHLEDAAPAALAGLIRRQPEAASRAVACVVANAFIPWAGRVAGIHGQTGRAGPARH